MTYAGAAARGGVPPEADRVSGARGTVQPAQDQASPRRAFALLQSQEQGSGMARAHIVICETIRAHHRLAFVYQGLARVVEPYCHGISTTGFEVLRAIQIAGASRSGHLKASSGKPCPDRPACLVMRMQVPINHRLTRAYGEQAPHDQSAQSLFSPRLVRFLSPWCRHAPSRAPTPSLLF